MSWSPIDSPVYNLTPVVLPDFDLFNITARKVIEVFKVTLKRYSN